MNSSKTTVTPSVAHNGTSITNVGANVSHSTNNASAYVGATREVGVGGSAAFFAGGSQNISNSSTISASAYVDTRKNYSVGVSIEKKF